MTYPNELTLQDSSTQTVKIPSRWLRILRRLLVVILIILVILGVTHTMWLPYLYRYLDVSELPHKADFIVMLGGGASGGVSGGTKRALEAANLYHQGYADRIILSGCEESVLIDGKVFEDMDVPAEAILINDQATNTVDEAQQILALLQEEQAKSALIVTDAPHTRRVQATYDHLKQDTTLKLTFVAAPSYFSDTTWWKSKTSTRFVLSEYAKGIYYGFRYGIWFF